MLYAFLICSTLFATCVYAPFRWLTKQEWPRLRRALYFPIAGQSRWEHKTQRARLLHRFGGVELTLRTEDERSCHAVWIEHPGSRQGSPNAMPTPGVGEAKSGISEKPIETPVVLLLHANAMVLDDMADWAMYYYSLGCSVMLLTFWGYPDPNVSADDNPPPSAAADAENGGLLGPMEERCPTERGMYLDAEAALRFIQQVRRAPIESTLVHGLSIGGACAASLGVQHPGLRVTMDQSFASLSEVSLQVGRGLYEQLLVSRAPRSVHTIARCLQPCILRLAVFVLIRMLFKTGKGGPALCKQDRMDNVRKAAAIKGDVFFIYAEHDEMMSGDIPERVLRSRYGNNASPELLHTRLLCVDGGHCSFFGDSPEAQHHYATYLHNSGFLAR